MTVDNVREMLELPILGVVPEDVNMQAALVMKNALIHTHPKSRASRAYRQIAARILGDPNYTEKVPWLERWFG
jgi:septum formation inhibitor-activating ATPase MinD